MYGGYNIIRPNFDPPKYECDPDLDPGALRITYPTFFFYTTTTLVICRLLSCPMSDAWTPTKIGPFTYFVQGH